jgi:hypothetical protein
MGPVRDRHVKPSEGDLTWLFVHDTHVTMCDVTYFLQPTPPPPPPPHSRRRGHKQNTTPTTNTRAATTSTPTDHDRGQLPKNEDCPETRTARKRQRTQTTPRPPKNESDHPQTKTVAQTTTTPQTTTNALRPRTDILDTISGATSPTATWQPNDER